MRTAAFQVGAVHKYFGIALKKAALRRPGGFFQLREIGLVQNHIRKLGIARPGEDGLGLLHGGAQFLGKLREAAFAVCLLQFPGSHAADALKSRPASTPIASAFIRALALW